jgi:hypothetical protein
VVEPTQLGPQYGEDIEITGYFPNDGVTQDTSVSDAAWQNIAQWIASRAHDYGITYEEFPLVKKENNRSFLTWHQEWTIGTGKTCPGPIVMNFTAQLIEMARAIMKSFQTAVSPGTTPPPPGPGPAYADPIVFPAMVAQLKAGQLDDFVQDGVKYYAMDRTLTPLRSTRRLQNAETADDAAIVGPVLKKGEKFRGGWQFTAKERNWIKTRGGTVVLASALTPRFTISD